MITETMLLNNIRIEIGDDLFNSFDPKYFIDIIETKSLLTWSIYFPFIIRGINITGNDAIRSIHPQTGKIAYYKYKVPKERPTDVYIGIELDYYPMNIDSAAYSGSMPLFTDTIIGKFNSFMPISSRRYSLKFVNPDIIIVDPIPRTHVDFVVDMQRRVDLYEVPLYYSELFFNLVYADIKSALYNKLKNIREGQTFQGLEVSAYIDDFSSAKDDRKDAIEVIQGEYYKNPDRFKSIIQYSN